MADKDVADALKGLLADDPSLTVEQLSEATEVPEGDVVRVLDSWDGEKMKRVGPGKGGNWV